MDPLVRLTAELSRLRIRPRFISSGLSWDQTTSKSPVPGIFLSCPGAPEADKGVAVGGDQVSPLSNDHDLKSRPQSVRMYIRSAPGSTSTAASFV